jgi:hypothetical protein
MVAEFADASMDPSADQPKGFNKQSKTAHSFYGFDKVRLAVYPSRPPPFSANHHAWHWLLLALVLLSAKVSHSKFRAQFDPTGFVVVFIYHLLCC